MPKFSTGVKFRGVNFIHKIRRKRIRARYRIMIYILVLHLIMFWNRYLYRTVTQEFLLPKKNTLFVNDTILITREKSEIIMKGFLVGYTVANIPFGFLCDLFQPKLFIIIGTALCGCITAMMPVGIKYSNWLFMVSINFVQGISHAALYPGTVNLLGHWIPLQERTTAASLLFGMRGMGNSLGKRFTIEYVNFTGNWAYIFYVWVAINMTWCFTFTAYTSNTPDEDKFITHEEQEFLRKHIDRSFRKVTPVVPMLMDINFWLIVFSNMVSEFLFHSCVWKLTLNVCSEENLEFFCQLAKFMPFVYTLACVTFGLFGDYLICKCRCKIVFVRILMATIGLGIASCCLIPYLYYESPPVRISCMFLVIFFNGAIINVTVVDYSINHIGFTIGFANAMEFVAGNFFLNFIESLSTKQLLKMVIGVAWSYVVFYCLFAKGYRAKWDYGEGEEIKIPRSFSWSCVYKKTSNLQKT